MKTSVSNSRLTTYFNLPKTRTFWLPLLGTITEYYDYALYGFTAVLLSQLYFPAADPTVSLLKTYVVFSLGSAAKPLGSLVFGWIGDLRGRKIALQWTMLGIFIPTTLIGLLPTYQEWGVSATIILILCRLFQGMFLSGEIDGVRITLYESFLKDRPALLNCIVSLSCYGGIFLASFIVSFIPLTPDSNMWRVPFLIGGVLGVGVFIMRRYLSESVDYLDYQRRVPESNMSSKISKKAFVGTVLMCGGVGGFYQLFFIFFGPYLSKILGLFHLTQIQILTPIMLTAHILAMVVAAWLTDHRSPQKVIRWGISMVIPLILILGYQLYTDCVTLTLLIPIVIATAFIATPGFNLILPSVGVGQRYRFVSLGHALGSVLLSGSAPALSLFLWQQTHLCWAPLLHALALCACVRGAVSLLTPSKAA